MAFITPNATDTSGGNRYVSIDQSEPDALDLEILGNDLTGTVTGCNVTSNGNNANVAVAAGVVVIGGTTYNVVANATFGIPAAPADNRFDLIVARKSGGANATLAVVTGENSATNPVFPKSINVLSSGVTYNSGLHVDLENETVLASLYRQGGQAVTNAHIVDKRVIRSVAVLLKGTGAPGPGVGVPGSLYQDISVVAPLGPSTPTGSGLYVKASATEWIPLARDLGPSLPIGGVIGWPSVNAVPVGCFEANGQGLATATYTALFNELGYSWGGSGATFFLPNYNDKYLRGTSSTVVLLTTIGSDTKTITTANLPAHAHGMAHTHDLSNHTHNFAHSHTGTVASGGSHGHGLDGGVQTGGSHSHSGNTSTTGAHRHDMHPSPGFDYIWNQIVGGGGANTMSVVTGGLGGEFRAFTTDGDHSHSFTTSTHSGHSHSDTFAVNTAGSSHTHTLTINSGGGNTLGPSNNTSGASSKATTDNAGSGTTLDIRPATAHIRWIIRASNA